MNTHDEKVGTTPKQPDSLRSSTAAMSPVEFARLGGDVVAYVKALKPGEVETLFPEASEVPADIPLYSLHAADGTPLVLTDSRMAAIANAIEIDLEPVSVH